MRCSNCSSENPAGKRFCSECGAGLPRGCPQCDAENAPAAKFCGECGASLNAPVSTPVSEKPPVEEREVVGERRHLTVLFSDLVSSTAISAQLDPEEWRELVADYHRAAAEAITRFGGFVAKYLGDGVMAYFGWPEAHDNDAERAARAGLAIIDAVQALNRHDGQRSRPKLSVRVGIDSGTVVIGKGGGSESEVFGDTANIASRVQSAAEADSVIVTPAVHRLVSGLFVVEERGTHQLKGIAQPVELYRIVRLSGARSRLAASAVRGLTPFVGRAEELGLLWNHWERASDGEGQVVFIVGEAGIGKSRLLRQFRKRLAGTPHTWNECAGAPYFQNTPFHPITDMLQQGYAERGNESDEAKLGELERDLELAGLKLAEAVPLIAPMLNVPVGEKYPPLTLSPEQKRKRLLTTLAEWLFGAARAQQLVMAVEDLHWFDASTLELMQLLVEQGATTPLLLVCTARPEFHAPWTPRAHHTHLTLNRLTARDVRELVGQVVATRALSGEAIDQVIERTGGVPLFVEEVTRAVLERGDAKPTAREIPATLHDSLIARLDRLGRAREVAHIASVIGREFSYELLLAVSSIPEDDLQSALAKLAEAELIYARGIPPEATYTFKHALIQDAAYEALLKSRRRELHRQVALAMTEKFPAMAKEQLEVVARHWTYADEAEPAIAAWRKAGDAAFERSAFKEAEEAYRRALELIRSLPESAERDARELELMSPLVQVLQAMKGWAAPEAAAAAAHARSLAEKTDNLEQTVLQLFGTWTHVVATGDLNAAGALADQLLELAERDRGPAALGLAHLSQLTTRCFRGDLRGVEQHLARGAAFFDAACRRTIGVSAGRFGWGSLTAWMLGNADTARDRIDQAIATANEIKSPLDMAYTHLLGSMLYLFLREPEQAARFATQSIALSEEHGFQQLATRSRMVLGRAQASLGRIDTGVGLVRSGLGNPNNVESRSVNMTLYLGWLAEAQALGGALSEALVSIEEALRTNPDELAWRLDALRIRGELRLKVGEHESAETDFRESIALANEMSAKALALRPAISLARMLKARGDLAEACDLLARLYSGFTEGFDTADLKDAKALLEELSN
jgi:class 3 adenylate cyclase/tetratricopeptide (TPR) repeat protein